MGLAYTPRFTITNTPTVLNNDAYDANDVIFDSTTLSHSMFSQYSGPFKLEQIEMWDSNDQTAAVLSFFFLNSSVVFGVADAAPSISDANALFLTGWYSAATAGQFDVTGSKYGVWNPNIMVQPNTTLGTLYYSVATAGTPTYLTGCLVFRFTFSA